MCTYRAKGYHPKISCMKKKIDMLTQLLENHNISLLEGAKKKESASNIEDKERFHAVVARIVRYPSFNIVFGASRHMVFTREALSSIDDSNGPKIVLGDDS